MGNIWRDRVKPDDSFLSSTLFPLQPKPLREDRFWKWVDTILSTKAGIKGLLESSIGNWVEESRFSILDTDNLSNELDICPVCDEEAFNWKFCTSCKYGFHLIWGEEDWKYNKILEEVDIRLKGKRTRSKLPLSYFEFWETRAFNITQHDWNIFMYNVYFEWKKYSIKLLSYDKLYLLQTLRISIWMWWSDKFNQKHVSDKIFLSLRKFTLKLLEFHHSPKQ